jgi:multicomponent Na+:H+ antiporter subunit A
MTRLHLERQDPRELEDLLRDGGIALVCGTGVTVMLLAVLNGVLDPRLSDFFNANSVPLAHGRNVVNVLLVDFRGLDTLGEIAVVMTAGIAILVLLRTRRKAAP